MFSVMIAILTVDGMVRDDIMGGVMDWMAF
jgi:hypothetical protein